jgi:predicted TIM-barrel fold metal-dependent hydrolase
VILTLGRRERRRQHPQATQLAGGYQRVWSAISSVLGELPPADRDAVLGGTARVFYQLGEA